MTSLHGDDTAEWYVMRDLKRPNALLPAYRELEEAGFDVFTPLVKTSLPGRDGGSCRDVPFIRDLLFVRSTRRALDPRVAGCRTLQYRYGRGNSFCNPMTVPAVEMDRFIRAVRLSPSFRYYRPGEVTPGMCGRRIRICGGPADGCEGILLRTQGSDGSARLLVSLSGLLSACVDIRPEYVQFV